MWEVLKVQKKAIQGGRKGEAGGTTEASSSAKSSHVVEKHYIPRV